MNISVITLFPELYSSFFKTSIIGKSVEQGKINYQVISLFSYVKPKERVDAPLFGHGPGMALRPDVIEKAITESEQRTGRSFRIFFSPHGKKLDQKVLEQLRDIVLEQKNLLLVAPRYEGVDHRAQEEYADMVISLGDFVLMGGDVPALALLEGVVRLVPGIVGDLASVDQDSFGGPFVDWPAYTEPVVWKNRTVPEVLRSGNHGAVDRWRRHYAVRESVRHHWDWVRGHTTKESDIQAVSQEIPAHYVALLHDGIVQKDGRIGTTSVTSLDIHDIARSARTYGLKGYFLVTPLLDQQDIVRTLLDFWKSREGAVYNESRHEAVSRIEISPSLDDTIAYITAREGVAPIIIGTSAIDREQPVPVIGYSDHAQVWGDNRPVLLLLGTGYGISPELMARCNYVLKPLKGWHEYNHLSVRSAAAIIFDRWLGRY